MVHCRNSFPELPRISDNKGHPVGNTVAERCIRQIDKWPHDSYFKNRYMLSIWTSTVVGWWHLHFLSAAGLIDLYIFSFIEIMIIISEFFQSSHPSFSSLSSRAFIFIVLQELQNYIQFNLLVLSCTIYLFNHSFIIVFNHSLNMTENENKHHDLWPRKKMEILVKLLFWFSIIVFNTMKLLVKTFKIKLFVWINIFKKV